MMLAYNIVLRIESREAVQTSLEKWRYAFETRGVKVKRSETQIMAVNETIDS